MSVRGIYFSPCGRVETVVRAMTGPAGVYRDITLPGGRQELCFSSEDLVFVGVPVYAGRVPNKLAPFLAEHLHGNGAAAAAVVCFGNRSFDNALAELRAILTADGFTVLAAAAVVTQHSFTEKLAPGRPNQEDQAALAAFGAQVRAKYAAGGAALRAEDVPGDPTAPYYTPLGTDGAPSRFLRAVPAVDATRCVHCGTCAAVCPMGSVDPEDPANMLGVCIKCQACVHKCPQGARSFSDPAFLSHQAMLEQHYRRPVASAFYV